MAPLYPENYLVSCETQAQPISPKPTPVPGPHILSAHQPPYFLTGLQTPCSPSLAHTPCPLSWAFSLLIQPTPADRCRGFTRLGPPCADADAPDFELLRIGPRPWPTTSQPPVNYPSTSISICHPHKWKGPVTWRWTSRGQEPDSGAPNQELLRPPALGRVPSEMSRLFHLSPTAAFSIC